MSGKTFAEPLPASRSPLPAYTALGVFGGTFDPIHFGHLRLAEDMADALGLDRVLLIPAGQPPHRDAPRTASQHRLEMVRRAATGNPRLVVDAREVQRPQPSYTVDTLTELRAELGADQPLWLLLGADAFLGLPGWHDWRRLFKLAHIAVATRPGAPLTEPDSIMEPLQSEISARQAHGKKLASGPAGSIVLRETPPLDISATAIRNILARQHSARYLLPDTVLAYIHEHQLYAPT